MDIVINEDDLKLEDIEKLTKKVRAILVDDNNNILIANYGGVILLPGGKIDAYETVLEALKRELEEKLGVSYDDSELSYLVNLKYFQRDYPERNGTTKNRLVETYYYVGYYKGIARAQNLTEKEISGNFKLELVPISKLVEVLEQTSDNPRNLYFQKELSEILMLYQNRQEEIKKS